MNVVIKQSLVIYLFYKIPHERYSPQVIISALILLKFESYINFQCGIYIYKYIYFYAPTLKYQQNYTLLLVKYLFSIIYSYLTASNDQ